MRDDRGATVHLRYRSKIDGKRQYDLLALAQTEVGSLDENASGAQIDGLAKSSLTLRHSDVNGCTSTMPRMQTAFHDPPLIHVGLVSSSLRTAIVCAEMTAWRERLDLICVTVNTDFASRARTAARL
jgi:hypothetical protein